MSSDTVDRPRRKKKEENPNFWRAIRFLAPYRGMVLVSVLCAVMVSAVFTSGLGAMLPIFKVLLEDQTVAQWMDHQIVEHRLGNLDAERSDLVTHAAPRRYCGGCVGGAGGGGAGGGNCGGAAGGVHPCAGGGLHPGGAP